MANKFDSMFAHLAPAVAKAPAAPQSAATTDQPHTGPYRLPSGAMIWNPAPGDFERDYPPGAPTAPAAPAVAATAPAGKFEGMFAHLVPKDNQAAAEAQAAAQLGQPSDGAQTPAIASKGDATAKDGQRGSPGNLFDKGGASILNGVTMGAADEILPAIAAPINAAISAATGNGVQGVAENYAQAQAAMRSQLAWEQENAPKTSMALDMAGSLATAPLLAGKVLQGAGLLNKAARGASIGAALGGTQAAMSNNGTLADRVAAIPGGAETGAVVGAVAPVAGRAVGAVGSKVYSKVSNSLADRVATTAINDAKIPASKVAVQKVARAFNSDANTGSLNNNPAPADMLMNTGEQMGAQAGAIATIPGDAQNVVTAAIRKQSADAGKRVAAAADSTLGSDAGRVVDASSVEAERKAAGKMYDVAKASGATVSIRPARAVLSRVIQQADGPIKSSLESLKNLRAFQNGKLWNGASATDIHSARMVLDDAMRAAGKGTNEARLLGQVRASLDDALKGGNGQKGIPGYAQADAAYKTVMDSREALVEGRDVFKRGFGSPQELKAEVGKMNATVRESFVKGARDYVSELMGTARNDAGAAIRELNDKGWNREKLDVLIGPQKAQELLDNLQSEARRQGLATNILGNSKTAKTLAAQKEFQNPAVKEIDANSLRGATATGLVLSTLSKGFNAIRQSASSKSAAQINREVADLLTSSGVKRDQITQILSRATRAKAATLTASERINALMTGLGVNAGNGVIAAQ